jgi:hypothetical protein
MEAISPNRLKLWRALSHLFLDTEVDDATFDYIARVVEETRYSPDEIDNILWNEVFPVLQGNLRSVVGEWAGWPDDWLLEHLSISERPPGRRRGAIAAEIRRCWEQVEKRLPPEST